MLITVTILNEITAPTIEPGHIILYIAHFKTLSNSRPTHKLYSYNKTNKMH